MLNQVMLVGRIAQEEVKLKKVNGKDFCEIEIAVPRSFKNANGEYETDFISCKLNGMIATNAVEYIKKGDIVGIKGRIQSVNNRIEIVVERITYLSSARQEEVENYG